MIDTDNTVADSNEDDIIPRPVGTAVSHCLRGGFRRASIHDIRRLVAIAQHGTEQERAELINPNKYAEEKAVFDWLAVRQHKRRSNGAKKAAVTRARRDDGLDIPECLRRPLPNKQRKAPSHV
jgi:hypothetical protein